MRYLLSVLYFIAGLSSYAQILPQGGIELGPNEPLCLHCLWHDSTTKLDGFESVKIYDNGAWVEISYYDPISGRYYRRPPIYLLVEGQSNAFGYTEVPVMFNIVTDPRVHAFDGNNWGLASIGTAPFRDTGSRSGSYNFVFTTAKFSANSLDVPVRILINAGNGWTIERYSQGVQHIRTVRLVTASGATNVNVLWHQGEANHNDSTSYWLGELAKRQNLFNAEPWYSGNFIPGELLQNGLMSNQNEAISTLPNVVKSDGLIDIGDSIHFASISLHILGILYGQKLLSLL